MSANSVLLQVRANVLTSAVRKRHELHAVTFRGRSLSKWLAQNFPIRSFSRANIRLFSYHAFCLPVLVQDVRPRTYLITPDVPCGHRMY